MDNIKKIFPDEVSMDVPRFKSADDANKWVYQIIAACKNDLSAAIELLITTDTMFSHYVTEEVLDALGYISEYTDGKIDAKVGEAEVLASPVIESSCSTDGDTMFCVNIATWDDPQILGVVPTEVESICNGDGHSIKYTFKYDVYLNDKLLSTFYIKCVGTYSSWDSTEWHSVYLAEPIVVPKTLYRPVGQTTGEV